MKLPPTSHALRPVRFISSDRLRFYDGVTFSRNPRAGCQIYYNRCKTFGGIAKNDDEVVGMCDVLDSSGDIIDDFPLTKKGLHYLVKALKLKVESEK